MLSPALSVISFSSEFYFEYVLYKDSQKLLHNCWILIVGHLNHIKRQRSLSHNDISGIHIIGRFIFRQTTRALFLRATNRAPTVRSVRSFRGGLTDKDNCRRSCLVWDESIGLDSRFDARPTVFHRGAHVCTVERNRNTRRTNLSALSTSRDIYIAFIDALPRSFAQFRNTASIVCDCKKNPLPHSSRAYIFRMPPFTRCRSSVWVVQFGSIMRRIGNSRFLSSIYRSKVYQSSRSLNVCVKHSSTQGINH